MTDFTGKAVCTCGKEMNSGGGSIGGNISCTFRNCECGIKAIFYTTAKDYGIAFKAEHKDQPLYDLETREKLLAIFKLAGLEVIRSWNIENQYCGGKSDWLLVQTKLGLIVIGWRKRVININWACTGIEMEVSDPTTKDKHMVHARSYHKALDYMEQLVNASELVKA